MRVAAGTWLMAACCHAAGPGASAHGAVRRGGCRPRAAPPWAPGRRGSVAGRAVSVGCCSAGGWPAGAWWAGSSVVPGRSPRRGRLGGPRSVRRGWARSCRAGSVVGRPPATRGGAGTVVRPTRWSTSGSTRSASRTWSSTLACSCRCPAGPRSPGPRPARPRAACAPPRARPRGPSSPPAGRRPAGRGPPRAARLPRADGWSALRLRDIATVSPIRARTTTTSHDDPDDLVPVSMGFLLVVGSPT